MADIEALLENLYLGFAFHEIVTDEAGKPVDYVFLEVNRAFEELTGLRREDLLGRRVTEVLPGILEDGFDWIGTYGRVALTGESTRFEQWYDAPLSRWYSVLAYSFQRSSFAVVIEDITAKKKAEEESRMAQVKLLHAQKLESLGVLAGGVAHDFNNILATILGHADMALADLSSTSVVRSDIEAIVTATRRATELCRQMLAYSGKGQFQVQRVDLNELVDEMTQMLRIGISKKAVLVLHLADRLPPVEADVTQVRQILMNLVTNASEAIGDRSGLITVSTGCMSCDQAYLDDASYGDPIPAGDYVYFEVSDTGCGMEPETAGRIFEPFFSTKFTGRGLGLAAVQGIVRGHEGGLRIYTEPGKGTTFKVLLPAAQGAVEALVESADLASEWRGSGTVLLVDDEETVRAIGRRILQRFGFDVVTAADGSEALEIYRQRAGALALVLLDLTMPHLDGAETFRELRRLEPRVPVILCSGYAERDVTRRFAGKGLDGFLQKPYRIETLREILRKVLEPTGETERG